MSRTRLAGVVGLAVLVVLCAPAAGRLAQAPAAVPSLPGFSAPAPIAPSPPGTGTIAGVVRNVSAGGRPEAGVPVQLVAISGHGATVAGEARSDAAGRFAFAHLADGRYLLTARYQGISYAAHAVVAGARAEVVLSVYEVSARVPLRVSLLGMAVQVFRDYVRVAEVVHLQNPTTRTFLGPVVFPLPRGARYVIYNDGLHQPQLQGEAIADRLIVRPGGHQVAYTYSVPGGGAVALERRLPLPVDRVELFVEAPAQAHAAGLQVLPSVTGEDGRTYTRASARAVAAGPLAVTIVGVPASRPWAPTAAAGTLAALLVLGLMWGLRPGASAAPAAPPSPPRGGVADGGENP